MIFNGGKAVAFFEFFLCLIFKFSFQRAAVIVAFVAFFVAEENFFEALKPFHVAVDFGFVEKFSGGKM